MFLQYNPGMSDLQYSTPQKTSNHNLSGSRECCSENIAHLKKTSNHNIIFANAVFLINIAHLKKTSNHN